MKIIQNLRTYIRYVKIKTSTMKQVMQ